MQIFPASFSSAADGQPPGEAAARRVRRYAGQEGSPGLRAVAELLTQ
jgi:hypothetical protein